MLLLEFAAQGVRGVAPAGGRATLRPGYNVLAVDGAALRRLIDALLQPSPGDAEALPRAAGGPVRAGLTLVGDDRVTYRLVRDFAAGCQLHRFDAERRAFVPVSQDLAAIAAQLRGSAGVPAAARRAALLTFAAGELPSRSGGTVQSLGGAQAAAARPAASAEEARRRIAALEAELARAATAERLQYQLDGLQSKLFRAEEALKGGARLKDALAAAEGDRAGLQAVAAVAEALGDPQARLGAYARAEARRDEVLARVAAERQALDGGEAGGAPRPPWTQPGFLAGAAVGLLAMAAGAAGAAAGTGLRGLALLALPAFGWSAWELHRFIGAQEEQERQGRRRRVVDEWERKVLEQFERDGAAVAGALQALQVTKVSELKDQLDRLAEVERALAEARAGVAAWEAAPENADAVAGKEQVEEALRSVEQRLATEVGGFVRDVRTVEAELERARAEAEHPAPGDLAEPAATLPPVAAPPLAAGAEPLRALLERAAAELGASPAAVARHVAPRASPLLAGLSMNRLTALGADDRGNVQATSGGRVVPAMGLPPPDRDLVYLALRLALLEQAVTAGRAVAVVAEPFSGLSDGARRTVGRFLKQAARAGQILHATTDPAFREAADHQA